MTVVANVFSAFAEPKATAMALANIRSGWPQASNDSPDVVAASC
jgi:hypothetical protein